MQHLKTLRNVLLATSAMALLAACASDSSGSSTGGGGGGGGSTTSSVPQLGVTGTGGATSALGVSALTDPILGTDGVLGGGGDGQLGGQIPASSLDPLSSQLAPVADQIASAVPLSTVTSQLPDLGVTGDGGLLDDVAGQDPLSAVVGTTGVVGTLVGGGNDGVLGDAVPAGSLPTGGGLPGGLALPIGDPTQVVTSLAGGLSNGTDQAALTDLVSSATSDPAGTVQSVVTTVSSIAGGAGSTSGAGAIAGVGNTVSSVLPSAIGTPVDSALTQASTALEPVTTPVTSALAPVTSALP
jgi:hypothetical protein